MSHSHQAGSSSTYRGIRSPETVISSFATTSEYIVPPNINAPLDPVTDAWMSNFAGRALLEEDFDRLNELISTGSENIGSSPTDKLSRGQYILNARNEFFLSSSGLDLGNPKNPLHTAIYGLRKKRNLPPIKTFVRAQRFQYANGMNGAHNIKTAIGTISISAENAAISFAALRRNGADPVAVSRKSAGFLELSERNIDDTVGLFKERGLDATQVLTGNPAVLGRSIVGLTRRIDLVGDYARVLGLRTDMSKLLSESPQWLSVGDRKLRVLANVLATHTEVDAIPETRARIKKIALLPIESILLSIVEKGAFTTAAAESISTRRPTSNRGIELGEHLKNPATLALLGEKTIMAYVAYAEKLPMDKAREKTRAMFDAVASTTTNQA